MTYTYSGKRARERVAVQQPVVEGASPGGARGAGAYAAAGPAEPLATTSIATFEAVNASLSIRPAQPADVELIYGLIVELATYERAPEKVVGTPEMLARELFGPQPSAEALVAELDGRPVGFALFHGTFSTWECRPGVWLEDLYVPPEHRRHGVGRALLSEVARIAVERGCARLEWTALEWNTPALDFYAKLGAEPLTEWVGHRLDGDALARVADAARNGR